MRMCKCTAKIVWDWEEQCFAAEYVWEFMSFCDNCWERLCESCWERFCESYWGSGIQVVEGVRIVNVLFTCWRCESFLSVNLIFADTSQNRQNILQLFFQNSSKQSTWYYGLSDTLFASHTPPKTDKKHRDMAYLTDMTRHDNGQGCKLSKIESLRLGFTFSKPSLTDSSLKPCWRPRGIYVELESQRLEFHVNATWNFATWEHANRALEARFMAWISSLKGSIC